MFPIELGFGSGPFVREKTPSRTNKTKLYDTLISCLHTERVRRPITSNRTFKGSGIVKEIFPKCTHRVLILETVLFGQKILISDKQ